MSGPGKPGPARSPMIGQITVTEAQAMIDRGVMLKDVASAAGCSPANISQCLRRGKLRPPP